MIYGDKTIYGDKIQKLKYGNINLEISTFSIYKNALSS